MNNYTITELILVTRNMAKDKGIDVIVIPSFTDPSPYTEEELREVEQLLDKVTNE